jgi:transposase InsO family protein
VRSSNSHSSVANKLSRIALSYASPTDPVDGRTRTSWHRSPNAIDVHLSIHYTERLAEARIESSVGSIGDSYDNALAKRVIGLYKTEVIRCRGPWRHAEQVEYATLVWVD